jgi:hypothetical protein
MEMSGRGASTSESARASALRSAGAFFAVVDRTGFACCRWCGRSHGCIHHRRSCGFRNVGCTGMQLATGPPSRSSSALAAERWRAAPCRRSASVWVTTRVLSQRERHMVADSAWPPQCRHSEPVKTTGNSRRARVTGGLAVDRSQVPDETLSDARNSAVSPLALPGT